MYHFIQIAICLTQEDNTCTTFLRWPIQRSWCQWRWWWRLCRWCHWSLYSLLTSTHTGRELAVTFCQVSGVSQTWPGQGGEAGGGGISGYSREQRAWGQICLLGEVNWLGGKVVRGERKKSGGRGTRGREGMWGGGSPFTVLTHISWYWSCDCSCHNLRYSSGLLLQGNAK